MSQDYPRYAIFRTVLFILFVGLAGCFREERPLDIHPAEQSYAKRGRELVLGLAACGQCHGMSSDEEYRPSPRNPLAGGLVLHDTYGEVRAPNLTRREMKEWKLPEFVAAIRKSVRPDDSELTAEHHLGYEWMSDEDTYAIASYIRTLPEVQNEVEKRAVGTLSRYTTGFFEKRVDVAGYVPEIPKGEQKAYGKYLVDHVARCTSCHNTPPTVFTETRYLEGGREIKRGRTSGLAPNITASETLGIGAWSESDILQYLSSGKAPGSAFGRSELCPTEFYKHASPSDLQAMALYLTSVRDAAESE